MPNVPDDERSQPPPFPDELRAEAARSPGGWVYAVDPAYDPVQGVPPEGIAGAWKVGEDGRPTGEYRSNPAYRPSELARRVDERDGAGGETAA